MNIFLTLRRAMIALLISAPAAFAAPVAAPLDAPALVQPVAANCNAIAQQMAAQYGGKARATLQNRGGQQVCVVVIVVQGKNGQRGERIEVVVPAN
ncbi:MAG: hypothetical protein ABIK36_10985 [Pseudomonadota bacterium]